jgi:hypothetical protein
MNLRKAFGIVILFFLWTLPAAASLDGTISGFVYDDDTREALIGTNVYLAGTTRGSSTNPNGYYSIPQMPPGEYEIVADYIGYQSFRQPVVIESGEDLRMDIYLKPDVLAMEEIVVTGQAERTAERLYQKPISQLVLPPREIDMVPQVVESDLLRTLQNLPGIAAVSDFSSQLYVRGGTPDQNLYLIDGVDIYNPEHLFGLFSTFNTDAIKNVDISKGGFGADHGGRLSSVLDVTYLDGNRREFEGSASVSLLSAKATLQSPLGRFGSLSGSIRRTYFDQTVGRNNEDIPNYYFYDGHGKAFLQLDQNNSLTISGFSGDDRLDFDLSADAPGEENTLEYDFGNDTGSLRWTHIFNPVLFSNFWFTASRFSSEFRYKEYIKEINDIEDVTVKGDVEYYRSEKISATLGFEAKRLHHTYEAEFFGLKYRFSPYRTHTALYLQTVWRPDIRWEVAGGLRYNYFYSDRNYQNISPRLSAKYRLDERSTLKAAVGVYHQYLHKVPRFLIADIWLTSDENYKGSRSIHAIAGYGRELGQNFSLEAEIYYKRYEDIFSYDPFGELDVVPDRYDENGDPIIDDTAGLFTRGEGDSYGLELLARKRSGIITGWLSGSLARTDDRFDRFNQGKSYPPRHDRTLTVNASGELDLRNGYRFLRGRERHSDRSQWSLGMNFLYATGQPITTTSSIYFARTLPDREISNYSISPGERNDFRLPPYARLDLSLTFERNYKSWGWSAYLQVFNVGNRQNIWFYDYEHEVQDDRIVQEIEQQTMLPLLPTIGFTINF